MSKKVWRSSFSSFAHGVTKCDRSVVFFDLEKLVVMNEIMDYQNVGAINLDVSCNVIIKKSNSVQTKVSIRGTDAEKVKVSKSGNELSISFVGESGSVTIVGGSANNVVIGDGIFIGGRGRSVQINSVGLGQSVSIVNGVVYVNGKQVKEDPAAPDIIPVSIEIECPDEIMLSASLSGSAELAALPLFSNARISCKGSSEAGFKAKKAKIKVSGSAKIGAQIQEGDLSINISGSAQVRVTGSYSDCDVSVSGSGSVSTSGPVSGDYDADVSGCGNIYHSGSIAGSKRKSISGLGQIIL